MTRWPTRSQKGIPELSAHEMREIDRMMTEELGVDLLQMMELAGSHLAELTLGLFGSLVRKAPVLVLAGGGNNGGGALSAARHLTNRGANVSVLTVGEKKRMKPAPLHQRKTLLALGIPVFHFNEIRESDEMETLLGGASVLVDGVIGYGLQGDLDQAPLQVVSAMNRSHLPIVSLDVPSGFEMSGGVLRGPCVRASATLALALPKTGILSDAGRKVAGRLFLGDIGVPDNAYRRIGTNPGVLFADGRILEISFSEEGDIFSENCQEKERERI